MNCDQFSRDWPGHLAGTLPQREESQMLDHSRSCDACGTRWRDHDELCVMLGNLVQPLKQPDNLAIRLAERLPSPAGHSYSSLPDRGNKAEPTIVQAGPLLLAAFAGGAVMYLMSSVGGSGSGSMLEQLVLMEAMGRRSPLGGISTVGLAASQGRELLSLLFTLALLVWLTRASFWEVLFPYRMPLGITLARWLAVPTLLIGALRLLVAVLIMTRSWNMAMANYNHPDLGILLSTANLLDQLWTLGFWLTLLVLLFGLLNEIALRHARPLQ